jgi:large subunit ribosomal protein L1
MAKSTKAKDQDVVEETTDVIEAAQSAPVEEITVETESETAPEAEETEVEQATAKAGKRSAKAVKEAEAKEAKEARKTQIKAESEESEASPKHAVKPTRTRLERRGKKFREAAKLIEKDKVYALAQAIELAQKTSTTKFDASVELHINLNVDPRQAEQNIRDNVVLPAGTGKTLRVAVFDDEKVTGADQTGVEAIIKKLEKGELDFDVLIASPAQMSKLGKYARLLGPRGLMPNPKSGTVATDLAKAVQEAKAGRIEYRVDSTGIVHLAIGKVSFTHKQLLDNAQAVLSSIKSNKPTGIKGTLVKSIHVTSSMGPSISIEPNAS